MKTKLVLSNAELLLLLIINAEENISGYKINKLIKEREYRSWVDLGKTSVYAGLKKLVSKKLVKSKLDKRKSGKGPQPTNYRITPRGKKELTNAVLESLSTSMEMNNRFDIAYSGITNLPRVMVVLALERRIELLNERQLEIKQKLDKIEIIDLPLEMQNVYEHIDFSISNEITFTKSLINDIYKLFNR